MVLRRSASFIGILLTSFNTGLFATGLFTAGLSCSAPSDGEDGSVPEFMGTVPGAGAPVSGGPGAVPPAAGSTGTPPANTPVAGGGEGLGVAPGSVPVDNAGANVGAMGAANGAGGSASVDPSMPAAPNSGTGGSAMPSAAGAGNAPIDDGQAEPPPVVNPPVAPPPAAPPPAAPPPVAPPPVTPPPVNAGPVGSGCAAGAAFFCEDFEALPVGAAQASNGWSPEGTVSIDGQVAQGTRSLLLQPAGGQFSRIVLSSFTPPNNSFFGRMNVFVEAFPTAPAFSHFVLAEVTGSSGERVRPIGGQFIPEGNGPSTYWGVGSDGGATGDWTRWEPRVLTENGRWICMEWEMNAADNSVSVFIDGTERPELGVSTNDHGGGGSPFVFPTFNSIWLGWWNFQGGTTPAQFEVRLDDIVLSSERVGCN